MVAVFLIDAALLLMDYRVLSYLQKMQRSHRVRDGQFWRSLRLERYLLGPCSLRSSKVSAHHNQYR